MSSKKDFPPIEELDNFDHSKEQNIDTQLEDGNTVSLDIDELPNDNNNTSDDFNSTNAFTEGDEKNFDFNTSSDFNVPNLSNNTNDIDSNENDFNEHSTTTNIKDLPNIPASVPEKEPDINANIEDSVNIDEPEKEDTNKIKEDLNTEESLISPEAFESIGSIKEFSENLTYGKIGIGGNPPHTVMLKNIKYKEDVNFIRQILKDHNLITDKNKSDIETGLTNRNLIISQISEYSAIYLAHKFRRFDLEILTGLSDEVFDSSHSKKGTAIGLISKDNLKQNHIDFSNLKKSPYTLESIILTTTPTLENYTIQKYIGVISEHKTLTEKEITVASSADHKFDKNVIQLFSEDGDVSLFSIGMKNIYHMLSLELQKKAFNMNGNAVIGITFQMNIANEHELNSNQKGYHINATGNVVLVS